MEMKIASTVVLVVGLLTCASARADGDAVAGKTAFANQCASCHTTEAGKNGFGPSLAGVVGRHSGSAAGYRYSAAMANANLTWTPENIDKFIADSTAFVHGTSMPVQVGDAATRANVVAYLQALGAAPAQAAAVPAPKAPTPLPAGPTGEELLKSAGDTQGWLYASKDYQGQRYVALNQINAANAHSLRATCIYRAAATGSFQSNPLVYKGTMYFTIDENTIAIDATTCREKWVNAWKLEATPLSKSNRGGAIADGRFVRGTPDGYLIALNMSDGSLVWKQKIADPSRSQYLSMPPLIVGDTIIYGPAGADWGAKNWIGAFKLASGEPLWKFNLIPDAGEPGADSWKDPASRDHGGGSLWTPLALDAAKGVLYAPVGNPAPDFYGQARPGDNLYTDSLVALDVKSGRLLWYRQFVPNDVNDRDLSQVSPLFSATVKGKPRELVSVGGKDGLLRVLDRGTHEQLYELAVTTRTGWEEKPSVEGAHGCPGLLGGMEWNGPAYSPQSKSLYVATVDWCGTFTRLPDPPGYQQSAHYYGGSVTPDPHDQARGWLRAIDVATGKERWVRKWPTPLVAGVTATSGGVLFSGDLANNFLAIDAASGRTLYQFNTGGSIGGGVLTYALGGKQYVATTSGVVSGFFGGTGSATIVVFALP